MAILNHVIHRYMEVASPAATFSSYVDNFEAEACSVQTADIAFRHLQGICTLLDLQLDREKTTRWSTTADGRSELRSMNIVPQHAMRDLGGHMQFIARRSNFTLVQRIKALDDFWPKLARSCMSKGQKLHMLRSVAWPRALHGGSIVSIGATHFKDMRTKAFQALGWDKPGANPQLHLSLIATPGTDPEFVVLQDSVLQCRRHGVDEMVSWLCAAAMLLPDTRRKPGPIGVLFTRLQTMCWSYQGGTCFLDEEGQPLDILLAPVQEVKHRLRRSWTKHVGSLWEHRKGFQGLHEGSVQLSSPPDNLSAEEAGLLRVLQNGTQFTGDVHSHFDETTNRSCAWCGHAEDSLFHRHWDCPSTEESRRAIPPEVLSQCDRLPMCTLTRGWMTEPPSCRRYRKLLHEIPDTTACFEEDLDSPPYLDLFVDGTGLSPNLPPARLVAWSMIRAGETHVHDAKRLAAGGVPGQWQTVARAELTAMLSAVTYAVHSQKPCAIWCDNQGVVSKITRIQQGTLRVTNKINDHDLWSQIADLLPQAEVTFQPIRSHQCSEGEEEWKIWAFSHNDLADKQAARSLLHLAPELRAAQSQVQADWTNLLQVKQALHQHFIRVGNIAMTHRSSSNQEVTSDPSYAISSESPVQVIDLARVASHAAEAAPAGLRFADFSHVLSWLEYACSNDEPVAFVSWYELLFSFQIFTGHWGVTSVSGHNVWELASKAGTYDVQRCCKWFTIFLSKLIRLGYTEFKSLHGRPAHHKFQCWMMGLRIRLSSAARASVTQWLHGQLGDEPIHGIARSLQHCPPATLEVEVPVVRRSFGLHRFFG
eukprot:Skav227438  [mRNA]  locus=scaffold203:353322:355775:- [translate_table: standard]